MQCNTQWRNWFPSLLARNTELFSSHRVQEISLVFRSKKPVAGFRSNMALSVPMQFAVEFGTCGNQGRVVGLRQNLKMSGQLCLLGSKVSSVSLKQYSRSTNIPNRFLKRPYYQPCQCSLTICPSSDAAFVKNDTLNLSWACKNLHRSPVIVKAALAVGVIIFTIWGLGRVVRLSRSKSQNKSDSGWKKGGTYLVTTSYILPLFLWAGVMFICRTFDPMVLPTEAGPIVKHLLNFVGSISAALAINYLLSCIELLGKKFTDTNDAICSTNPVIQFMDRVVDYIVRVLATLSFIEASGFSIMKWNIAHVFGLVFSMFVGHEILKRMRTDESTLTSKGGAADIQNPSTASEEASLNSLDGILMQLKEELTRQTSANVVSEAQKKSLLASVDELKEQISSVFVTGHPCAQSDITEARCAAPSTSEEDKARVKPELDIRDCTGVFT